MLCPLLTDSVEKGLVILRRKIQASLRSRRFWDGSLLTHSVLQRLLPRFGNELIAGAAAHEMSEAGKVQVHAGDRQPVSRHHVEHAPARDRRGVRIGVELHAHFRTCGLYLWHVHRVAPDQQLLVAGTDKERRVARLDRSGAWILRLKITSPFSTLSVKSGHS